MRHRATITEKSLAKVTATDPRGTKVHDGKVTGFGCTKFPSGKLTFWVLYQAPRSTRRCRYKLGDASADKTVEDFRDEAQKILGRVLSGEDPQAERQRRRKGQTFGEWVDEYLAAVKLRKKRPQHDAGYLAMARKEWGTEGLESITTEMVERFMLRYAETLKARDGKPHTTAPNRLLASIRSCLQSAWRLGLIPVNPAMRVAKLKEGPPRSRVLSDAEMHRLLVALETWKHPHERAAFMLLIQTGARLSEVLRAKWSDVDLAAAVWTIPSPKAGHPQATPLAAGTVAMLRRLERVGELVIPGASNPDKPRFDLKGPWDAVRTAAKLGTDVHLHDIRRSFGLRVARAAGLHVASKLLRHGDVKITEKVYAPLGLEDLRPALDVHTGQLAKVLKMKPRKVAAK